MSVRVASDGKGGWEVDIRLRLPSGQRHRERRILKALSKSAAHRWGQDRERHLWLHGPAQPNPTDEGGTHPRAVRAQVS